MQAIMYYQGWRSRFPGGVWRHARVTANPNPDWVWLCNECLWLIPGTGWEDAE